MSEKMKLKLTEELSNQSVSMIVEVDKCTYDNAEDIEAFLQQIHDEYICEICYHRLWNLWGITMVIRGINKVILMEAVWIKNI